MDHSEPKHVSVNRVQHGQEADEPQPRPKADANQQASGTGGQSWSDRTLKSILLMIGLLVSIFLAVVLAGVGLLLVLIWGISGIFGGRRRPGGRFRGIKINKR